MHRIKTLPLLILFVLGAIAQSKAEKSYSIPPVQLDYDSTSVENILQAKNAKRISSSLILVSWESMVSNDGAILYYKKDSLIWYGIYIDYERITVDSVDLDSSGRSEIILHCYAYSYGSGGGSGSGAFIVINIDSCPMELMHAKYSCFGEAFGRTYGDDTVPIQSYSVQYDRKIVCKNNSIIIYPNNLSELNGYKETTGGDCELTQLSTGIYRMVDGRLTLIMK